MIIRIKNRNQLHFFQFLLMKMLYIIINTSTKEIEVFMHHILNRVIHRNTGYQSSSRITISQGTHHFVILINNKQYQRIRH